MLVFALEKCGEPVELLCVLTDWSIVEIAAVLVIGHCILPSHKVMLELESGMSLADGFSLSKEHFRKSDASYFVTRRAAVFLSMYWCVSENNLYYL